jgi:hypothetical protein
MWLVAQTTTLGIGPLQMGRSFRIRKSVGSVELYSLLLSKPKMGVEVYLHTHFLKEKTPCDNKG